MKCKYCGAEITDDSEFCTNCGKRSENINQTQTTYTEETNAVSKVEIIKKFRIPIIVCCCIAAVLIFVFIKNSHDYERKIIRAVENTFKANSYICDFEVNYRNLSSRDKLDKDKCHIEMYKKDKKYKYYREVNGSYKYSIDLDTEKEKGTFCDNSGDGGFNDTGVNKTEFKANDDENSSYSYWKEKLSKNLFRQATEYDDSGDFFEQSALMAVCQYNMVKPLKQIFVKYLENNEDVDCIKEFKHKGDTYTFIADYEELINTLQNDYGVNIKNFNLTRDEHEYYQESDFTIYVTFKIKKNYIEKLNIKVTLDHDNSGRDETYGDWTFKFSEVNKLKEDDVKKVK